MVTLLPLMVQSAVPGGLGRLLLSCCGFGSAWAEGVDVCWAEADAVVGCAKTKAASMKMVSASVEKCLPVMMNVLSRKDFIIAQPGRRWPAAGAHDYFFCRGTDYLAFSAAQAALKSDLLPSCRVSGTTSCL